MNFQHLSKKDSIDLQDECINKALWFLGRAFVTKERNSRPIFFYTALELIFGTKSIKNMIQKIYEADDLSLAHCKLKEIKSIRDNLVHKGQASRIGFRLERYILAICFDGIIFRLCGNVNDKALSLFR